MQLVTLYYDLIRTNPKTHKRYHYTRPKAYTWIADDELASKIANTEMPAMITVQTSCSNSPLITTKAFIASTVDISKDREAEILKKHKLINTDDFKADVWHANDEQQKLLDHLINKLQSRNN